MVNVGLMPKPKKPVVPVSPVEPPPPEAPSPVEPEDRQRLIIDLSDPAIHAAIELRASKMRAVRRRRVTKSEAAEAVLREGLTAELAEVTRYREESENE